MQQTLGRKMVSVAGVGDLAPVGDLRPRQQDERTQRGLDVGTTLVEFPVCVDLTKRNDHGRERHSLDLHTIFLQRNVRIVSLIPEMEPGEKQIAVCRTDISVLEGGESDRCPLPLVDVTRPRRPPFEGPGVGVRDWTTSG